MATARLTRAEVLARRLATQRLSTPGLGSAAAVVDLLACVQSQEWAHGFWSLSQRAVGLDKTAIRAEFDAGAFVRTHVLRPTWHFVAPADLGWLQRLTAPRVHQRNAGVYRSVGLDPATMERGAEIIIEALRGTTLTRAELGRILTAEGVAASGSRLAHVVMAAELEALICSGPIRGSQHTYARVDERIGPVGPGPADPLAELARRFLAGHAPATAADLARWSSLTVTDAREAFARLGDELTSAEVATDGAVETVWWPAAAEPDRPAADDLDQDRIWWLPLYDELPLTHPAIGFAPVAGHPHRPGDDVFTGSILAGADNLGFWKRTVRGRSVLLETSLAPGVSGRRRAAVRQQGERLAEFLGKAPVWSTEP